VSANTPPHATTTAAATTSATATTKTRTRTCWTEQDKTECLALFAQSGLTAAEFCRQLGISAATFSLWRRTARSGEAASVERMSHFAQVCLTELEPGTSTPEPITMPALVIQLRGGTRLEAAVGTDPIWLAQLVKTLGSA
jgi:transposase-like protein